MEPDPFFDLFPLMFAGASLFILIVGVIVVVAAVRNHRKIKEAGHDPMTLQSDLATRAMNSELLRPASAPRSLQERLQELDGLRAAGTITAEEHAAARADVLRGA